MSAKWVRSQRWDDRHLTGALWPVKVVLRTFSWISTAVVLLSLVAVYGVLASVPIGLLAKAPTVLFYALTFVLTLGIGAAMPVWVITGAMRTRGAGTAPRWVVGILGFIVLAVAAGVLWWWGVWPHLRFDAATGSGVRFFGAFTDKYSAVQFRRLPMMEMSELEFYSWWPLRVVLLLFVLNLVVATIRRIEFTFPRIGVLTVHTGIITIALGSVYYATHKQEGDMILLAAGTDDVGHAMAPRAETGFYDNTRTALWVTQNKAMGWDQRPLHGVPRYNDYNLNAVARPDDLPPWVEPLGPLNIPVPAGGPDGPVHLIDSDITFRIVGYASYAELDDQWIPGPTAPGSPPGERIRELDLVVTSAMPNGGPPPRKTWRLFPDHPAGRVGDDLLGIEYTIRMPEERWALLATPIPEGSHAVLIVEHPASGFRVLYPVQENQTIPVGTTGYTLHVKSLLPTPPLPIVTRGYEGASSSIAIVHVDPPAGAGGQAAKPGFDRWIYSRFPEITQDLSDELNERGMPKRRDADPALRITYLDTSTLGVYFDEQANGTVRALVRQRGGNATITLDVKPGTLVQIAPVAAIKLGAKMDGAVHVEVPQVVPPEARDRERIGNHKASAVAVEVGSKSGTAGVHWVPFTDYLSVGGAEGAVDRDVRLPDGREVSIAFGRIRHEFWPEMSIRLHDFEMIPYEHSDTPRDYLSDVVVKTAWPGPDGQPVVREEIRRTSLNNPLLIVTPYVAPPGVPLLGRMFGHLFSVVAPNQYKFAQAGWDQGGWRQSEQEVAAGKRAKPAARFTILGVGNNPGIYIIASGAVMMSIGIPWAFYLKPWLMQREKRKIQERLAREESGGGEGGHSPTPNGTARTHESQRTSQGANT